MKRQLVKIMMAGAACIVLAAGTTMAQNGRFSVGAELGLPLGTFGDGSGIGFGGTLRYELPLGDKMGLTGTAGYMVFSGKEFTISGGGVIPDQTVKGNSSGIIPIQVGFKYYFNEAQDGFYAMAEVGVHMAMVKVATYDSNGLPTGTETESSTNLSYAPGLGYHLANLDFGLRFQLFTQKHTEETIVGPISATTTSSYIGLRVAYVFGEK
ncbi:MAG TPA: outer membrane beta-barrel protein [Bacteroidia bacterium]|nr:outer membrane beta-barrel protein [Bacteroidia bacterium]